MAWPPRTGELLPRAEQAWCEPSKWNGWILAAHGHGPEWEKVLHVTLEEVDTLWEAIAAAVLVEPVSRVVGRGRHGLNCRGDLQLSVGGRSAVIRTAWHYADPGGSPRLVSAYPRL